MQHPQALYITTATAVVFSVILGIYFLIQTGLPSSDVIAREKAQRPIINVSEYGPGDVKIVTLNNRPVIVWRRNEADRKLAAYQNTPDVWRHQSSMVLGRSEAVFADDANLTLNHEWFFALAEFPNKFQYLLLRAGDFEGFFEGRYAAHFDLAGRIRKGGGSTNLTVIRAEYLDGGQSIQLYFNGKP